MDVSSLFLSVFTFPGIESREDSIFTTFHKATRAGQMISHGAELQEEELNKTIEAEIMFLCFKGPERDIKNLLNFKVAGLTNSYPDLDILPRNALKRRDANFRKNIEAQSRALMFSNLVDPMTGDQDPTAFAAGHILDRRLGTERINSAFRSALGVRRKYKNTLPLEPTQRRFRDIRSLPRITTLQIIDHPFNGELLHLLAHGPKDAFRWVLYEGRPVWLHKVESSAFNILARWEPESEQDWWNEALFRYPSTSPIPAPLRAPHQVPQIPSSLIFQDLRTVISIFHLSTTMQCQAWLRNLHSPSIVQDLDNNFPDDDDDDDDAGDGDEPGPPTKKQKTHHGGAPGDTKADSSSSNISSGNLPGSSGMSSESQPHFLPQTQWSI
ncbi:hypothetical protein C8J56DRAFT_1059452 [Mycena floridula]|nr:hypothetical protein C8J56DRAFT_1059452 [Mycena floridula]